MLNLEDYYEDIPTAYQYTAQGNFEEAINIYTSLLDNINPDDETVPYLYLNYANCLIKNCNQFFIEEIKNIHSGFDLKKREIYEDDLENAWSLLEICRSSFSILKDEYNLSKTYFLLGEISLLNNEFRDAIRDFIETESLYKKCKVEDNEYIELYMSMSSAYEFLEEYEQALKILRDVEGICKKREIIYEDIREKIEEIESKKERPVKEEPQEEEEDTSEIKDINNNKRRL
ncbi:G-protein-signaling modulator 2 [Vairimorpha necatrix]|uniref:G-protein-signaling modulator 2 n=1 Tax=Vairimorpha necatrix TaxID=6039 RepID=A0AAX4JBV1_9MICR